MAGRTTRNDVAKLAGVSSAVVSYVINNSNYVSEEKRKAVLEAIEALEYTPNLFAKSLKTNRSSQIALVGDSLQGELFGEIANGLYDMGFYSSLFYSQPDDEFIKRIIAGRFDAVFMTSNSFSAKQLSSIVANDISMVLYKSRPYENLDKRIVSIAPDFYDSVKKSIDYLALKGHREIAYIPPLKYKTSGVNGDDFRAKAYVNALQSHHLPINPAFFCVNTKSIESILSDVFEMLTTCGAARPSAFVVGDDHLAAQVMQYFRKFSLEVPRDIAVVGWGNIPSAVITTPQLTTVDYGIKEFSQKVCQSLQELVAGSHPADAFCKVRLIIRESS